MEAATVKVGRSAAREKLEVVDRHVETLNRYTRLTYSETFLVDVFGSVAAAQRYVEKKGCRLVPEHADEKRLGSVQMFLLKSQELLG